MILYKKEPYRLQMKNIMLLDDIKTGGVVYVNKNTYDQALLLHNRFDGNVDRVLATLKNSKTEIYITIPGLITLVENMGKSMPEPLNILAPFLILAAQNKGINWDGEDIELAYGILHQYSQLVDFNAITLVPAEVRTNITIPTGILTKYKESWDDLCSTLEEKVVEVQMPVIQAPVQVAMPVQVEAPIQPVVQTVPTPMPTQPVTPVPAPTPTPTPVATPTPAPVVEEDEEDEDDFITRLRKRREAAEQAAKKDQDEKKVKDAVNKPAPKPAPVEEQKQKSLVADKAAEEKAEVNAILDDTDF